MAAGKTTSKAKSFTDEEMGAMKERARELKEAKGREEEESDCNAQIARLAEPDRAMAKRIHALIKASAPNLSPKTWYGMPAYALEGNVICFFQSAAKFKTRYATLGFSDKAKLDEGSMWPNAYALKEVTSVEEAKIAALLKKALG